MRLCEALVAPVPRTWWADHPDAYGTRDGDEGDDDATCRTPLRRFLCELAASRTVAALCAAHERGSPAASSFGARLAALMLVVSPAPAVARFSAENEAARALARRFGVDEAV